MYLLSVVLELYNLFAVWATLADEVLVCRVSGEALRWQTVRAYVLGPDDGAHHAGARVATHAESGSGTGGWFGEAHSGLEVFESCVV